MVIVVVKNFGSSTESNNVQDKKRPRALPPEGWKGENKALKKRQNGERAVKLKHILKITANREIPETDSLQQPDDPEDPPEKEKEINGTNGELDAELNSNEDEEEEEEKKEDDWKSRLKKMMDEIKKVQELPKIVVPDALIQKKIFPSATSPDLTLYSAGSQTKNRFESSWEIRARYRNMRSEELFQSQVNVQKTGYSWRDRIPEITTRKPKFTENKVNVVTQRSFVGSSYVGDKLEHISASEDRRFLRGTKSYSVDLSIDINSIKIQEAGDVPNNLVKAESTEEKEKALGLQDLSNDNKFLMITYPGCENITAIEKVIINESEGKVDSLGIINEEEEGLPELEEVPVVDKPEAPVAEQEEEKEKGLGGIISKMKGDIASMEIVVTKRKQDKKLETKPNIPDISKRGSQKAAGVGGLDWRLEIKKREHAKQQKELNAMPLGMPEYAEPEKMKVNDWRDALKEQEEANNPLNKWRKLSGGVKKPRAPPPKPVKKTITKEEPCTCNVGTCKQHSKFTLRLAPVKKVEPSKIEEPLKRRSSVKKTSKVAAEDSKDVKSKKLNGENSSSRKSSLTLDPLENANGDRRRGSSVVRDSRAPSVKRTVTKVINFVAIQVTVDDEALTIQRRPSVKKTLETKVSNSTPNESPSPPKSPERTQEESLPPLPAPPPMPPTLQKSPTPPLPPPPRKETPPVIVLPTPVIKAKSPSPPPYKSKAFPMPVKSEPWRRGHIEVQKTSVKLKYVEENNSPKYSRKRYSADIEVKPVKFSADRENCVKQAVFTGNQYVGPDTNKFNTKEVPSIEIRKPKIVSETSPLNKDMENSFTSSSFKPATLTLDETCDKIIDNSPKDAKPPEAEATKRRRIIKSLTQSPTTPIPASSSWRQKFKEEISRESKEASPKKRNQTAATGGEVKTSASTKIIEILTKKSREDKQSEVEGLSCPSSPKVKRRLSEYVYEKLRLDRRSKSGSNTPASSPKVSRKADLYSG